MKVVFLTKFDFTNERKDGGVAISFRNYKLIEELYGKENVLLCIVSPFDSDDIENIRYFKVKLDVIHSYLTYFCLRDRIPLNVEKKVISCINSYHADLIFFDGSTFGQLVEKLNPIEKKLIYFHNIERQYTWEQVRKHSPLCIFRYFATCYTENKMVKITSTRICMNKRDERLLNKYYGVKADFIFPATFEDNFFPIEITEEIISKNNKMKLLFVGSYFAHNYKGLIWFIDNVLPYIDCELWVVGKNMEKLNSIITSNSVFSNKLNIVGTVDSLEKYYLEADAMVMPIFMGGGMKVKTAEALMYGKTIFASTESLQGYDVEGVSNIFRCDTNKEYIEKINNYISNKDRSKFNQNIRTLFLERYCTEIYKNEFTEYLKEKNMYD